MVIFSLFLPFYHSGYRFGQNEQIGAVFFYVGCNDICNITIATWYCQKIKMERPVYFYVLIENVLIFYVFVKLKITKGVILFNKW